MVVDNWFGEEEAELLDVHGGVMFRKNPRLGARRPGAPVGCKRVFLLMVGTAAFAVSASTAAVVLEPARLTGPTSLAVLPPSARSTLHQANTSRGMVPSALPARSKEVVPAADPGQPTLSASVANDEPFPTPRGWVTSYGVDGGMTSPPGIDCGDVCSAQFAAGTMVTLWPVAFAGSAFARWEDSNGPLASCPLFVCRITLMQSTHVIAVFSSGSDPTDVKTKFTVSKGGSGDGTLASRPPGIACGASCTASYPTNVNITLTVTPDGNSEFTGWTGPCEAMGTAKTCVVTVGPAIATSARFDHPSPPPPPSTPAPSTPSTPSPPQPPPTSPPARPSSPALITAGRVGVRVGVSRAGRTIVLRMPLRVDARCSLRLLRRGTPIFGRTFRATRGANTVRVAVPRRVPHGRYRVMLVLQSPSGTSQRLSWPVGL